MNFFKRFDLAVLNHEIKFSSLEVKAALSKKFITNTDEKTRFLALGLKNKKPRPLKEKATRRLASMLNTSRSKLYQPRLRSSRWYKDKSYYVITLFPKINNFFCTVTREHFRRARKKSKRLRYKQWKRKCSKRKRGRRVFPRKRNTALIHRNLIKFSSKINNALKTTLYLEGHDWRHYNYTSSTIKGFSWGKRKKTFRRITRNLRYPITKVLMWTAAGKMGFSGKKRRTPYAAQKTADFIVKRLQRLGVRSVNFRIKNSIGYNIRGFLRGFSHYGPENRAVRINRIFLPLGFRHGSMRRRNKRRT